MMRWRIRVVDDEHTKVEPIHLGPRYTAAPDNNEDEAQSDSSDDDLPPRVSMERQVGAQWLLHGTTYSSILRQEDDDDEEEGDEDARSIASSVDMLPAVECTPSTKNSLIEPSAHIVSSNGIACPEPGQGGVWVVGKAYCDTMRWRLQLSRAVPSPLSFRSTPTCVSDCSCDLHLLSFNRSPSCSTHCSTSVMCVPPPPKSFDKAPGQPRSNLSCKAQTTRSTLWQHDPCMLLSIRL